MYGVEVIEKPFDKAVTNSRLKMEGAETRLATGSDVDVEPRPAMPDGSRTHTLYRATIGLGKFVSGRYIIGGIMDGERGLLVPDEGDSELESEPAN